MLMMIELQGAFKPMTKRPLQLQSLRRHPENGKKKPAGILLQGMPAGIKSSQFAGNPGDPLTQLKSEFFFIVVGKAGTISAGYG